MRLRLCNGPPTLETGAGKILRVSPAQGVAIRLLFTCDSVVDTETICYVAPFKNAGSMRSVFLDLRDRLGVPLIHNAEGTAGHVLELAGIAVDASEGKSALIEATAVLTNNAPHELDLKTAFEVERILAPAIWKNIPSDSLMELTSSKPHPPHLANRLDNVWERAREWVDIDKEIKAFLAWSRIATGRDVADVKIGIGALRDLSAIADSDDGELIWGPLLWAMKLHGDRGLRPIYDRCVRAYEADEVDLPEELLAYQPKLNIAPARTSADRPIRTVDDESSSPTDLLAELGVTVPNITRLRGSQLEPDVCISATTRRLWFGGVLGGKWVTDPRVRTQLESLLDRLDDRDDGSVRFLVVDPDGPAYPELENKRGGRVDRKSVDLLVAIADRHRCLEVAGMSRLPLLRHIIIDDEIVGISPYEWSGNSEKPDADGWRAPHVILDPSVPHTLAHAFREHFTLAWDEARLLSRPAR